MKISIVIPNYNGEEILKINIPRVLEAVKYHREKTKNFFEVIVADDASSDNSIETAKEMGVKVIINSKNLGFSSTVNEGVSQSKGEIVFLLNTDAYPQKDFLNSLPQNFSDPMVFAVGCLDKSLENGKKIFRGRGIGKWEKGFLVHRRGEVNKTNTLWASGGSSAFRRSIWNKLGGFDELYNPFYWEDIDLSYRALKSGYKVLFDSKSIVYHEHKKGSIKKNYSDFDIKTISFRNQFIFAWKNGTDLSLQFNQFLFLPYHLIKAFKNRNWPFFLGFLKALSILPKIIKSSLEAQRLFIRSDSNVIKDFKI